METKLRDNAKLGVFVIAGLTFLVFMLYMIGKNRNLLGSTFPVTVRMENVNGLLPGNNVRFRGLDVGTVKEIRIADDTSIYVVLTIRKKFQSYIKQNSIASIGTDGLMGNKLVNINSQEGTSSVIREGSIISSLHPIETDEMLRTLNTTNNSIAVISRNLEQITDKLNRNNSLWSLLGDTSIAGDIKLAVKDIRRAGKQTADFTAQAEALIADLRHGEGLAGALLADTAWKSQLNASIQNVHSGSRQLSEVLENLNSLVTQISDGTGTTGQLISDTVMRDKLIRTLMNAEEGTARFSENMEALKQNFLFRRYFRKQKKKIESSSP